LGLTGNAIFHNDVSDASSDLSDSNLTSSSYSGDSAIEQANRKANDTELHLRREITYTAYGENLSNTAKLLTSNKNAHLLDHKNDIKGKRFFITSTSTKFEHRLFFGNTKTAIWDNLLAQSVAALPIRRVNFIDRSTRLNVLSYVKRTIESI
jgi:hypothetical protein